MPLSLPTLIVFVKKLEVKKSSAYLPTLFDFRALAETKFFFYLALCEN